jgi:hypothetical protein
MRAHPSSTRPFDAICCDLRRQIDPSADFRPLARSTRADRKPSRMAHDQKRLVHLRPFAYPSSVKHNRHHTKFCHEGTLRTMIAMPHGVAQRAHGAQEASLGQDSCCASGQARYRAPHEPSDLGERTARSIGRAIGLDEDTPLCDSRACRDPSTTAVRGCADRAASP